MLAINNPNVAQCSVSRPAIAAPVPTVRHTRARKQQPTIAALSNVAAPVLPGFALRGTLREQAVVASPASQQAPAPQFPAVLSAAARTPEQVAAEVEEQLQMFPQALVQGVEPEMYACLRKLLSGVQYHARAKMLIVKPKQEDRQGPLPPKQRRLPGMMCVVSAGPEDQAAADQVKLVAEHMGCFVTTKAHFNIRDLQGLMDKLPALQAADAVVAIAGADGSLPGALAGLIDAPVIALPTSQGNTAGLGGLSGLVAAVSSCNLGVSAVGIDQAPAAAAMAARMLRMTAARVEKLTAATAAAAAAAPPAVPAVPVAHVNGNGNGMSAVNNVVPTMLDSLSLTPALAGAAK